MPTINEILVAADAFAGKMDRELGAATERNGVRDFAGAQKHVSAAHEIVGQMGRDLAAMAKVENTKPPGVSPRPQPQPAPAPPPVSPPATTDDQGRALVKCPVKFTRTVKFARLIGLFMRGQEMAVEFVTPDYTSTVRGQANSFEYIGAPQYKTGSISDKPYDFSFGPGKTNLDGPQGTNNNYFYLGTDHPKYVRLEPNRTYYYNLRSYGWTPQTALEQFAVEIYMPEPQ